VVSSFSFCVVFVLLLLHLYVLYLYDLYYISVVAIKNLWIHGMYVCMHACMHVCIILY
jgi:hypothetical protein